MSTSLQVSGGRPVELRKSKSFGEVEAFDFERHAGYQQLHVAWEWMFGAPLKFNNNELGYLAGSIGGGAVVFSPDKLESICIEYSDVTSKCRDFMQKHGAIIANTLNGSVYYPQELLIAFVTELKEDMVATHLNSKMVDNTL